MGMKFLLKAVFLIMAVVMIQTGVSGCSKKEEPEPVTAEELVPDPAKFKPLTQNEVKDPAWYSGQVESDFGIRDQEEELVPPPDAPPDPGE